MGYVFEPSELRECVRAGIGKSPNDAMDAITAELAQRYGDHVDTSGRDWILNNAGGAMGQLALLHGSLTEYLIFFGSPIGTEGHSGRYATEVYDWVFSGEMWCYLEGETERRVYEPGSEAYLGRDQVKGYKLPEGAWMLEYARGPIPTMVPFGVADTALSTLDMKCLRRTVAGYGKLVVKSLLRGKI